MQEMYCMACAQIIPREKAAIVFKTGYYKIRYPLGFCAECEARRARDFQAQNRFMCEGEYDVSRPIAQL